ncbi:MAG: zinc ABC transporter substrate-binding protein [Planctomycetota bacterium]|nr:MAG: zinc ABC transporter substrate-binding protein [Planctomycetota bacterium]
MDRIAGMGRAGWLAGGGVVARARRRMRVAGGGASGGRARAGGGECAAAGGAGRVAVAGRGGGAGVGAAGGSPHGYAPTPSDVAAVGRADLVVLIGMGIESGLPASVRDGARVVSMAGVLGMDADDGHDHAHDHDHDHGAHDGADPHLWLDPSLVEEFLPALAERVIAAMERAGADAAATGAVAGRLAGLLADVREVDAAYRERLAAHQGAVVITQHAAWSRLTDRYGLVVASEIQVAEQTGPSAGRMAEIVRTAEAAGRACGADRAADERGGRRAARRAVGRAAGVAGPPGHGRLGGDDACEPRRLGLGARR